MGSVEEKTVGFVPRVGAVVLGWGEEPLLGECVQSLLDDGAERVVLVDNGVVNMPVLPDDSRLTVVSPGRNTGFAGGCNVGAEALGDVCDVFVFANSDLIVRPGSLQVLAGTLADAGVGLVCGLVLLYRDRAEINSAGNPVHYSLMSWAGQWGAPAGSVADVEDVAGASGALMAMRRADWFAAGGLWDALFAYGEDMELSMRVRQAGLRVVCNPDAAGFHDYSYSAGKWKFHLLERNRLAAALTLYDGVTLLFLAPLLAAVEAGVWAVAVREGWVGEKLRGYRWLWRHRGELAERRRWNLSAKKVSDRDLLRVLTPVITPSEGTGVTVPDAVNKGLVLLGLAGAKFAGTRTVPAPVVAGEDTGNNHEGVYSRAQLPSLVPDTAAAGYTRRLQTKSGARWKRAVDVQRPYRNHLRSFGFGRVLDVGCGIGRTMTAFDDVVGVDHNPDSIAAVRGAGYTGWTTAEWETCPDAVAESFDTVLFAHVLEHMGEDEGRQIVEEYLRYVRPGGRLVIICPQEAGQASDATHVRFLDFADLEQVAHDAGCVVEDVHSFPFPRRAGKLFRYNESMMVARKL